MKNKYHILLVLFLLGCSIKKPYQPSEKIKTANNVRKEASIIISNKFNLLPFGSGGQMLDKIEMLMLAFQSRTPLSEQEARRIIVESTEEFINAINKNEPIRLYLANYPCTEKNIELVLYIKDSNGRNISHNQEFDIVSCIQGVIKFKKSIKEQNQYKLITVHQETFQESKRTLRSSKAL